MATGGIVRFVDWWTVGWTAILLLGYVADITPWPRLRILRSPGVTKLMLALSTAVVFGFTLAGAGRAASTLTAWAIVFASLNWLFHYFKSLE